MSGFYLNKNKSKILLKNEQKSREKDIRTVSDCEIVNKVKYLGTVMTAKNLDLFKNNFDKWWEKLDKDILFGQKLNLSFLGKTAVVKIMILPKVLFLLQTIPGVKDQKQFEQWLYKIKNFI